MPNPNDADETTETTPDPNDLSNNDDLEHEDSDIGIAVNIPL